MFLSRIPYHVRYRVNLWRRKRFAQNLALVKAPDQAGPALHFRVISFSCSRDLPDQLASWRSLLQYMGFPRELLLVSDGSHTASDEVLVSNFSPIARMVRYEEFLKPGIPEFVHEYARQHPFGKKLAVFLSMQSDAPVLYSDSDILYFPGADRFSADIRSLDAPAAYLLDCSRSHDTRVLLNESEGEHPVNGGFVYFERAIDFNAVLQRLENLAGEGNFFTEQTLVHLAVRAAGGKALDPRRYVLQYDDQWSSRDAYAGPAIAMRHYISSIRHKMWQHVALS